MKYLAIVDETLEGYSGFSESKPRIYVHRGQRMKEISCVPIKSPIVIFENGATAVLTKEHISLLFQYEKTKALAEISKQQEKENE